MLWKHLLMEEEVAGEVSGGGGTATAETTDQGTEATPSDSSNDAAVVEDDASDLLAEYTKLSGASKGDDKPAEPATDEVAEDVTPDDHSGDDKDGDGGGRVEDEASAFDDDLVDRARLLGFSDDDIESFSSNVQLERTLAVMGKRLLGESGSSESPEEPATTEPEPRQETTTPKQEQTDDSSWREELRNTDEFDPIWQKMVDDYEAMEKRLEEIEQQHVQRESALVTQAFDDAVNSFDGPFESIYGKAGKLSPDQLKARQQLFEAVAKSGGVDGLSNKSLLKTMAIAQNHEAYEKHLTQATSAAVKRNGKRRLRPAGSATTTKKVDAPAVTADGSDRELQELYAKLVES